MDAVGDQLDPGYAELRRRLDRDRERRGPLDRIVSKLLGMDMKMAQYRTGKAFCDEVVAQAGVRTLNQVWKDQGNIPTQAELDSPEAWVARVGRKRALRLLSLFR
jgi:putative hydrolase